MSATIVISGASGLVGSALASSLRADGLDVTTLVRRPARSVDEVSWDPDLGTLDPDALAGARAVVNLNGASIGHLPWTAEYKRELVRSRIRPTRTLTEAIRQLGADAPALVSASAVGYYGSAPGVRLTERSAPGDEFLSALCVEWESAARRAEDVTEVALLRTAPIVHPQGVLRPLIALTRLGLGGPIGRGTQVWPWISLEDEVRAIRHVIDDRLTGPVNLSGPTRASANDLGFAVARRLNRPYLLRAPAWALRLVLGQDMADSVLTTDADTVPERLLSSGFTFAHPSVEDAVAAAVPDASA